MEHNNKKWYEKISREPQSKLKGCIDIRVVEYPPKYDACSPINEHTPTAEVIQRWQGLMREIRGSFDLLCPEFIIAHWPVGRSGQERKIGMRTST